MATFLFVVRKLLFILFVLCIHIKSVSQKEANNWYFGNRAAITFKNGSPAVISDSRMVTPEGCATVSDKNGRLLFYTNGVTVFNSINEVMENGDNLAGHISSTQSSLIVPIPENDSLYYIFTVDFHGGAKGLNYSVVNIVLNNGLGKVVRKNIKLFSPITEKISAVHHCNNKDIWVTVRAWNSDLYWSYLIDKNGLSIDPVPSATGNIITGREFNTLGAMKIAPNGSRIATCHAWNTNAIELGYFDRTNGSINSVGLLTVSPEDYETEETGPYGLEFSSNGKYLYVFSGYGSLHKSQIYQFDVSRSTIPEVQASRKLVAALDYNFPGSMQIGPDGKIYIADPFDSSLSVINRPNESAAFCDFKYAQLKLDKVCALGLPNFIQTYVDPEFAAHDFTATGCTSRNLEFKINRLTGIFSVQWDFGDPTSGNNNRSSALSPSHVYPSDGFYIVTLILRKACSIDTIRQRIYAGNLSLNLSPTGHGCIGDSVTLDVTFYDQLRYEWSNGGRTSSITVKNPGRYFVEVQAGCIFSDSTDITFTSKPVYSLGDDIVICTGQKIRIGALVNGTTSIWNTGETEPFTEVNQIGTYWMKVTDNLGCLYTDTVQIKDKPFPDLTLGNDTLVCETEVITIGKLTDRRDIRYLWQDGNRSATRIVRSPGLYRLKMFDECTIKEDSITIRFHECPMGIPNAFTPNGDGRNDRFRARYGIGVGAYKMKVFNRWGQLVHETTDQLKGWDGKKNGLDMPAGTYIWSLQYTDTFSGQQMNLKGTVILVR